MRVIDYNNGRITTEEELSSFNHNRRRIKKF